MLWPKNCITKVNKNLLTSYCITKVNKDVMAKVLYYKKKVNKVFYYKSKQRCYGQSIVLQR